MYYKTAYVWTSSGVCSISHLYSKKRRCYQCFSKKYISKNNDNLWECMSCCIKNITIEEGA